MRKVGSFKKGTMIKGHNVADIVVILKTLPTKTAVEALGTKVHNDLKTANSKDAFKLLQTERGFDISNNEATVRILITTLHQNLRKLESDQHLDVKICQGKDNRTNENNLSKLDNKNIIFVRTSRGDPTLPLVRGERSSFLHKNSHSLAA